MTNIKYPIFMGAPLKLRYLWSYDCVNPPVELVILYGSDKYRLATRFGRFKVLVKEFASDIRALWHYGAPFPTFLKLIGSLLLFLLVLMPLIYPIFVIFATYYVYEGIFLSWWLDEPYRFHPVAITKRALSTVFRSHPASDMWKVREVLTRGILLAHSMATSVDYLCVMQGLLDES